MGRLVGLLVVAVIVFGLFTHTVDKRPERLTDFSDFVKRLQSNDVYRVEVGTSSVVYWTLSDKGRVVFRARAFPQLIDVASLCTRPLTCEDPEHPGSKLDGIRVAYDTSDQVPWWTTVLVSWIPWIITWLMLRRVLCRPRGTKADPLFANVLS